MRKDKHIYSLSNISVSIHCHCVQFHRHLIKQHGMSSWLCSCFPLEYYHPPFSSSSVRRQAGRVELGAGHLSFSVCGVFGAYRQLLGSPGVGACLTASGHQSENRTPTRFYEGLIVCSLKWTVWEQDQNDSTWYKIMVLRECLLNLSTHVNIRELPCVNVC